MKNILVCTIARNQEGNLPKWYSQLSALVEECPDWSFTVSVYENDSTDRTLDLLRQFENASAGNDDATKGYVYTNPLYGRIFIKTEKLGTQQFGSVWSEDRLKNLALYRNKCLEGFDLRTFDKIAYIEPDVTYDPQWCKELILAEHPRKAGFTPDIYSAWSLRSAKHPKESTFLYDTCATRQGPNENCWDFKGAHEYNDLSLIKTHITDIDSNCLHTAWSTFSCFCVYSARPFAEGIRFGHINHRFDTGQAKLEGGWLDADTVVICERFRTAGYEKICYNTNCLVRHN